MQPGAVCAPISFGILARTNECRRGFLASAPNAEYFDNSTSRDGKRRRAREVEERTKNVT